MLRMNQLLVLAVNHRYQDFQRQELIQSFLKSSAVPPSHPRAADSLTTEELRSWTAVGRSLIEEEPHSQTKEPWAYRDPGPSFRPSRSPHLVRTCCS